MKLSFDKFERYELPQVTLCNPNSRATEVDGKITITDTVGVLSNPKEMNLKLNFNAPHELSFDYYRHKSSDPIKQSFYDSIYDAIQTDRYVYLTDIGYFVISSVTDSDEDNIDRKSISLKSCEENELATAEGLHLKEGTYYLYTENNDGLLDLFLPKTAGWTIGYIDPSLLTKPYFVEDTEVDNGYNFLYTTIQDMFECIVEPDIIKRTISVYSRAYYAEHHLTDIHIAKYNLLKHKTVEENDEDKYTALNVQGKDENLEIRAVNPTGKNVIYNFEPRYAWMSSALQQAIEKWQEKCESVEEEYLTLQQGYYTELEKLFNEEQDIEVLKGELKTLEETRDAVLITTGEEQSTALDNVNAQISAKQTEINTATSNYNTHKTIVQVTCEEPIGQINKNCALDITAVDIDDNIIFTTELLNELMTHIKPTDYVDEYMLVTESMTYPQKFEKAKELMDRAQSQLVKISSGQKTYSIDTRSFLFNKQFKHFSEQLCAGAIIYVETKNDTMEQLHLTSIDINFDEKSTNFTLGNKYDRSDLKALYEDALGKNSKSFSELQYIASIIEDQQKQLDYQRNWVADLRTLTLDNVLTSEDQAIEINNRGLTGRKRQLNADGSWKTDENGNPLFDAEQVKLINQTLVFTDDNWETAKTAIGKIAVGYNSDGSVKYDYGFNGRVVIGELFLGTNLVLTGTGAGIKIKDTSGENAFYADNEGNLVLLGHIRAKSLTLEGCTISTDDISGLSSVAISGNYNDLKNKPTIPSSVADLGLDTSKIIYKGDIKQSAKTDSNGISYTQTTVPTTNGNITYDTYNAGDYIVFGRSKGTNSAGNNYICVSEEGLLTARNALIYGTVYATDGEFIGRIVADEGKIGGWNITSNALQYKDASDITQMFLSGTGVQSTNHTVGSHTGKDFLIWANSKFGVTNTGEVYATAGQIAGWKISATTLKGPKKINDQWYGVGLSIANVGSGGNCLAIGEMLDESMSNWNNAAFRVTGLGKLYATGAEVEGKITATEGNIGGWNIASTYLKYGGNIGTANSLYLCPAGTVSSYTIGGKTQSGWCITAGANFGVDKNGNMYASSGQIAGWNINSTRITTEASDKGSFYLASAAATSYNNWLVAKNSSGTTTFKLSKEGILEATGATITGTVNATGGTIGGWTLGESGDGYKLTSGTIGQQNSVHLYTSFPNSSATVAGESRNDWRLTVGSNFGVTRDGNLYCNGLNATGGSIGGWEIEGDYLYAKTTTKDVSNYNYTQAVYLKPWGIDATRNSANPAFGSEERLRASWFGMADASTEYINQSYSDFRLKNTIEDFFDKYEHFFDKLIPKRYKYNYGTSDRFHTGFIAQEVAKALEESGLTTQDFAGVCLEFNDEENGYWKMRRDEFVSLNTWQIQKAKARITELENIVAELKTQIQTLTAG